MDTVKAVFQAVGAFLGAVAAFFVKLVKGVVAFFARANDTYKGYINFPELVVVILTSLAADGSVEHMLKAVAQDSQAIFLDPQTIGHAAGILTALAGLAHRYTAGDKVPLPSARKANPRTRW